VSYTGFLELGKPIFDAAVRGPTAETDMIYAERMQRPGPR
jgi:hypothetical protein